MLSNLAKAKKSIEVQENHKDEEKTTYISEGFLVWSIHSTLHLHTLCTADYITNVWTPVEETVFTV